MDKRRTAIDWLVKEFNLEEYEATIKLAKAMEKEQMDKVSEDWFVEGCSHMKDNKRIYQSFEQYYTSTYGQ